MILTVSVGRKNK